MLSKLLPVVCILIRLLIVNNVVCQKVSPSLHNSLKRSLVDDPKTNLVLFGGRGIRKGVACQEEEISNKLSNPYLLHKALRDYVREAGPTGHDFIENLMEEFSRFKEKLRQTALIHENKLPLIKPSMKMSPMGGPVEYHGKHSLPSELVRTMTGKSDVSIVLPTRNLFVPGADVRVTANGKTKDIGITVMPMMTVADAILQAEMKMKLKRGDINGDHLIRVSWSAAMGCSVVKSVGTIESNGSHFWTITVIDSLGNISYNGVCLPENQIFIRPGSLVKLDYEGILKQ